MSIFKTAYDTTACAGLILDDVREKVKEAVILGQIQQNEDGIYEITGSQSFVREIPSFFHPILVDLGAHSGGEVLVIDSRPYYRAASYNQSAMITDAAGHSVLLMRAKLTKVFIGDFRRSMQAFSTVPVSVYSAMIADAISYRLMTSPSEYMTIRIIAAMFYTSLFSEDVDTTSQSFIDQISLQLNRSLSIPARDIRDVAEKIPFKLTDITSFCDAVKELVPNSRIKNLNFVTLATMLGGMWFGPQARELVNVSLEHPPTFIALVYKAYNDRSFRKSRLGSLLDNSYYKKQGQDFTGAINNMTR